MKKVLLLVAGFMILSASFAHATENPLSKLTDLAGASASWNF